MSTRDIRAAKIIVAILFVIATAVVVNAVVSSRVDASNQQVEHLDGLTGGDSGY